MSHYPSDGSWAVEPTPMSVEDRVRFDGDRYWWTVAAVSAHFVALVRQAAFRPKGNIVYTVVDWRHGVRGPCNLLGQGYDIDGADPASACERMLAGFEYDPDRDPAQVAAREAALAAGRDSWSAPRRENLSVSQRNWVRIEVVEHLPAGALTGASRG